MRVRISWLKINAALLLSASMASATGYDRPICRKVEFSSETVGWIMGEEGIYRSTDGGRSWTSLNESYKGYLIEREPPAIRDGAVVSDQEVWILVGLLIGTKLLRTLDGGQSWVNLTPARPDFPAAVGFHSIHVNDGRHVWLGASPFTVVESRLSYVAPDFIVHSEDVGESWSWLQVGPEENLVYDILFSDDDQGWYLNNLGISATQDSGESWELLFPQSERRIGDRLAAGEDGALLVFSKYRIEQFGGQEEVPSWPNIRVEDLLIDESGRIWVAGFAEDTSRCLKVRRLEGGEWEDLKEDCDVEPWVSGAKLFLLDSSTGWVVRFGQRKGWSVSKRFSVDRTLDGGQSWERLFAPQNDPQ